MLTLNNAHSAPEAVCLAPLCDCLVPFLPTYATYIFLENGTCVLE